MIFDKVNVFTKNFLRHLKGVLVVYEEWQAVGCGLNIPPWLRSDTRDDNVIVMCDLRHHTAELIRGLSERSSPHTSASAALLTVNALESSIWRIY